MFNDSTTRHSFHRPAGGHVAKPPPYGGTETERLLLVLDIQVKITNAICSTLNDRGTLRRRSMIRNPHEQAAKKLGNPKALKESENQLDLLQLLQ